MHDAAGVQVVEGSQDLAKPLHDLPLRENLHHRLVAPGLRELTIGRSAKQV